MSTADPLQRYLDAAREGDNVAVNELVLRTQRQVTALCRSLGSVAEAEDLVQETYLRAFRSLDRFRGEVAVQSWLLTIARGICADFVRRQVRQRSLRDRLEQRHEPGFVGDPGGIYGDLFRRLDSDKREAFVFTQVLGLEYQEAAEVLGCPIGTVRSRVARARAELAAACLDAEAV